MSELTEVASGLAFPEGPIAMPDGTVILVEMFGPRLTRVHPDGTKETIAEIPGGPNGAAVGPGRTRLRLQQRRPLHRDRARRDDVPRALSPRTSYIGGRIQTVDLGDRRRSRTCTPSATADRCGRPTTWCSTPTAASTSPTTASPTTRSASPTSPASTTPRPTARRSARSSSRPTSPTASACRPTASKLYWAETWHGPDHAARHRGARASSPRPASSTRRQCLYGFPGFQLLDSLAVDGDGNVCVATIVNGGVSRRLARRRARRLRRRPATSSPPTSASAATT